jgi:hypothetical protein
MIASIDSFGRLGMGAAAAFLAAGLASCETATDVQEEVTGTYEEVTGTEVMTEPPPEEYKKASTLVELPDYLPGIGTLYVQPETLPAGPFLAYNRDGELVSTIYMIPLDDLQGQQEFDSLAVSGVDVDHVDMYYTAGHPGVAEPHYHVVLWHIPSEQEATLQ